MNLADVCDRNQTRYGCQNTIPMMPFAMHSFNSMMICGKRAGQPFVNATRPDSETRLCPNNTLACSNFTAPDNTVCYPSD
jgi:hypothetical protein